MTATEIEPGTCEGDLFSFYETLFRGSIKFDIKKREVDVSKVVPIYPDHPHYDFLLMHIKSLGYTIVGAKGSA